MNNYIDKINFPPNFYIISCIVIAFRFVGRPGHYVYVFDDYRMEEVSTSEIQTKNS